MFTILLHSSKTMRQAAGTAAGTSTPRFIDQAAELAAYAASLSPRQLAAIMKVSPALAERTRNGLLAWRPTGGLAALDAFSGDIYSGLQASSLNTDDRAYANETLVILSGLYGLLRPLDAVQPYRLEIGYAFPDEPYHNLYRFWSDRLARALPAERTIINTSSAEYTKALFPHLPEARIITPKFLSVSPKTGQPIFVTVHAKIARGAFAGWLVRNRIEDERHLSEFAELGYRYDAALSSELEPTFVAKEFKGIGLSVRLT